MTGIAHRTQEDVDNERAYDLAQIIKCKDDILCGSYAEPSSVTNEEIQDALQLIKALRKYGYKLKRI